MSDETMRRSALAHGNLGLVRLSAVMAEAWSRTL